METVQRQLKGVSIRLVFYLLGSISILSGCIQFPESEPPTRPPEQETATRILDIVYTPNPLVSGDSATFKAVIRDSLQSGFLYSWGMSNKVINDTTNIAKVLIDLNPGEYNFSLIVMYPSKQAAIKNIKVKVL